MRRVRAPPHRGGSSLALTPGLVFADDIDAYAAGLDATLADHIERVSVVTGGLRATSFAALPDTVPCEVDAAHARVDGKLEVRFRGPNVMRGYWRAPAGHAPDVFDEEGYYRSGDAVRFVDAARPELGLAFDGRIAEDFKLDSGTFVSVGPMRARIVSEGAPYVQDAVITGMNREDVGVMIFPRVDSCRSLAGLGPHANVCDVLKAPSVRAFFAGLVARLNAKATGSATFVARVRLLSVPASLDLGEVTDKGSINQRAVLQHRAALVEALHADAGDPQVLHAREGEWVGQRLER